MDNIVEESEYITLGDDGTGATIEIPTVFVSEKVGEIL